ncbi:putative Dol-P-Man:Man(7)GlcNAc(2)-PP-Dol alpha-1 [Diplonema papillatum]|nr:putative Dol-P-Man:Man(7)GlcNAc(2)-PP-Dol alpha-1 [Diplonema papillatum]
MCIPNCACALSFDRVFRSLFVAWAGLLVESINTDPDEARTPGLFAFRDALDTDRDLFVKFRFLRKGEVGHPGGAGRRIGDWKVGSWKLNATFPEPPSVPHSDASPRKASPPRGAKRSLPHPTPPRESTAGCGGVSMGRRKAAAKNKEPSAEPAQRAGDAKQQRGARAWCWVEAVPVAAMLMHLLLCPYTKVEESFGMQATHDLLYVRNMTQFDHLRYPGVVPRSFLGPLGLTVLSFPVARLAEVFMEDTCIRTHALFCVRLVLGLLHCAGLISVGREARRLFGDETRSLFLLLTAVQFHGLYYASRTLPNSFAMVGVLFALSLFLSAERHPYIAHSIRLVHRGLRVLTVTCLVFRADLVVLIVPLLASFLATYRVPFVATCTLGITTGLATILVSTLVDSLFWGRPIWPEGEVLYFNTVLNKSSEWGVMPFLWYFNVALPKALLAAYPLVPLAVWRVRELHFLTLPAVAFVLLYSFLPHKELRFIFYAFPVLNLAVACLVARCLRAASAWRWAWLRQGLVVCVYGTLLSCAGVTACLAYASSWNYPGGDALAVLHRSKKGGAVHIDTGPSMEGITRFQKNYCGAWSYDKTPHLLVNPETGKAFDFHITFDPANYTTRGYRTIFNVSAFQGPDVPRIKHLDLWPPPVALKTAAYVVEISSSSSSHFQSIVSGQDFTI